MEEEVKKSKKSRKKKGELTKKDISDYKRISRNLGYPPEVREALDKATSHIQCENIMKSARNKYM